MPKTCTECRKTIKPEDPDEARALEIEYEATMAAIESVLHHYRILALRLEHLVEDADEPPAPDAERHRLEVPRG